MKKKVIVLILVFLGFSLIAFGGSGGALHTPRHRPNQKSLFGSCLNAGASANDMHNDLFGSSFSSNGSS